MTRINPSLPPPPTPETTPASAPSPHSEGLYPRPQPAATYGASVASYHAWNEASLSPTSGAGPFPALAEAGKPFDVRYYRGLADLGESGEIAKVEVHWRIDGGEVQSKVSEVTRDLRSGSELRLPVRIDVPAAARGELEYWFKIETTDGRTLWDSQYGRNYRTDIVPTGGPTLRFDDLWGESVSGPIVAGETLRIAYDIDRLQQFLYGTSHHGFATWSVAALVSFDGRPPVEVPITMVERGPHGESIAMNSFEAALPVPEDARSVSIWFRGSSYGGSKFGGGPAWDSNESKNYTFPVEPARP